MSESTQEIVDRFMGALNSIKAHLDRDKTSSDLNDLREALGMNRKNESKGEHDEN